MKFLIPTNFSGHKLHSASEKGAIGVNISEKLSFKVYVGEGLQCRDVRHRLWDQGAR